MANEIKIGILGAGNMGSAIISGLVSTISPENITVFDCFKEKVISLKDSYNISSAEFIDECIDNSDYLIIAVKPAQVNDILKHLTNYSGVIISIAAGVKIKNLETGTGFDKKIVRAMPNTPSLVGEGMTAVSANENITSEEMQNVTHLFSSIGRVITVEEKLMDAVTGVSGSGPAYVYTFIQAMADGAVKMGLNRDQALLLSAQTVFGSAKMILGNSDNPISLRDKVTSPGGTTIEGVHKLERAGFNGIIIDAIEAGTLKSKELGEKS